MQFLIYLVLFSVISYAASTGYKNCDQPTKGEIKSLTLSRCPDTKDVCHLVKNTLDSITLQFVSGVNTDSVTGIYQAYKTENGKEVGGPETVPYEDADICKNPSIQCPLKKGQMYTYRKTVNVTGPDYNYLSKFTLKDDNGDDILCFKVPIVYVKHY